MANFVVDLMLFVPGGLHIREGIALRVTRTASARAVSSLRPLKITPLPSSTSSQSWSRCNPPETLSEATSTTSSMSRYNERVVWNDRQLNLKLLRKGVLTRIYAPMAIVQGLRESGVFTSVIAASQSLVNDKLSLKKSKAENETDSKPENLSRKFITANSRKILHVIGPANRDSAVPPLSPPSLVDEQEFTW